MLSSRSSAFTLIELLIVVAIIGVLAGIVVISISGSTTDANDSVLRTNLRSIGTIYYQAQGFAVNDSAISLKQFCGGDLEGTSAIEDAADALESQIKGIMYSVFSADGVAGNTGGTVYHYTKGGLTAGSKDLPNAGCASSETALVAWAKISNGDFFCIDSRGTSQYYSVPDIDTLMQNASITTAEVYCDSLMTKQGQTPIRRPPPAGGR